MLRAVKITSLLVVILLGFSNRVYASETSRLTALGNNVVINYYLPVESILPNKYISFNAEYTGNSNTSGMDWMGTVCGKHVSFDDAGKTINLQNILMPKMGNSCIINLTAFFRDHDALIYQGSIKHTIEFISKPPVTFGTNNAYMGSSHYYVQSSVPQGHTYSYWSWYVSGCGKASTGGPNMTVSRVNHPANGNECKVNLHAIAKYDDTINNQWRNNKFIVYKKIIKYDPLD